MMPLGALGCNRGSGNAKALPWYQAGTRTPIRKSKASTRSRSSKPKQVVEQQATPMASSSIDVSQPVDDERIPLRFIFTPSGWRCCDSGGGPMDGQEPCMDAGPACKTPPRSGSGASCGRPGSRELERLWMADGQQVIERGAGYTTEMNALPVNCAVGDVLCHEQLREEIKNGEEVSLTLSALQRHASCDL